MRRRNLHIEMIFSGNLAARLKLEFHSNRSTFSRDIALYLLAFDSPLAIRRFSVPIRIIFNDLNTDLNQII